MTDELKNIIQLFQINDRPIDLKLNPRSQLKETALEFQKGNAK